jgi:hypothetical protein
MKPSMRICSQAKWIRNTNVFHRSKKKDIFEITPLTLRRNTEISSASEVEIARRLGGTYFAFDTEGVSTTLSSSPSDS